MASARNASPLKTLITIETAGELMRVGPPSGEKPASYDTPSTTSLRLYCELGNDSRMKLSVAMITYNQERFIGQAIESVLAQEVNL